MEKKSTSFLRQFWQRLVPKAKAKVNPSPPKFEFILKLDGQLRAQAHR